MFALTKTHFGRQICPRTELECVAGLVTASAVGERSDWPEEVEWKDEVVQPPAQASHPTVLRREGRPPIGTVRWWWWSWGGQW